MTKGNLYNHLQYICQMCYQGLPDLWLCMSPDCTFVGCGRYSNRHAFNHYDASGHAVSLKICSLELWCNTCNKWLGTHDAHLCEQAQVKEITSRLMDVACTSAFTENIGYNQRRQKERSIYGFKRHDTLYFVAKEWFSHWRAFLMGNGLPPGPIDNSSLFLNGRLIPDLNLMDDFEIISESNWSRLVEIYTGGPPASEDAIGGQDYEFFRSELQILRRYFM